MFKRSQFYTAMINGMIKLTWYAFSELLIHTTQKKKKKETLHEPSTPTTVLLWIYISSSLLITLTVTKSWRCRRKKANLSPLFLNPHFPTSSLPQACNLFSSKLLYASQTQNIWNSLPQPTQHFSRLQTPFKPHQLSAPLSVPGTAPLRFLMALCSCLAPTHTVGASALLSLVRTFPPHVFADTDCSHHSLAPRCRPQTPPPPTQWTISSPTCTRTISHLRNMLKLMTWSCQFWCMSLQL